MATKDELEQLKAENERLTAAQAASAAQTDQMIDMLAEMRTQLDGLASARQMAGPQPIDPQAATQAALDRERAALLEEFKDFPNIDVIEHRLTHSTEADPALRLKAAPGGIPEPGITEDPHGETCYWKLRWFNFEIPGRAERFKRETYQKVLKEELQDPESIPNLSGIDQYVRKGERGMEVLGKIPRKIFNFKKKQDAVRAGRMVLSESLLRDHVSNHVASMAGATGGNADEAGSTVHSQFSLSIKPGQKEHVTA